MVDAVELRAVALFGSLDDQELESLASCAELVEIPSEGVDLTRQGDFGHAVFAVVGGTADVTVDGSPVRQLGRGDVFGEIAVLSSGRRTATVTSTSPMRLVSRVQAGPLALRRRQPRVRRRPAAGDDPKLTRRARADQTGSGFSLERTASSRASRAKRQSSVTVSRKMSPSGRYARVKSTAPFTSRIV